MMILYLFQPHPADQTQGSIASMVDIGKDRQNWAYTAVGGDGQSCRRMGEFFLGLPLWTLTVTPSAMQ